MNDYDNFYSAVTRHMPLQGRFNKFNTESEIRFSKVICKKILRNLQNPVGWFTSKERSLSARSIQMEGPPTEKARRCLIAKRARGTRSSPLVSERSTRRAATSDTGRQRSRK